MCKNDYLILFKLIVSSNLKALPKLIISTFIITIPVTLILLLTSLGSFKMGVTIFISIIASGFIGSFIKRCFLIELGLKNDEVTLDDIPANKVIINILITFLTLVILLNVFGLTQLISIVLGVILLFFMLLLQII